MDERGIETVGLNKSQAQTVAETLKAREGRNLASPKDLACLDILGATGASQLTQEQAAWLINEARQNNWRAPEVKSVASIPEATPLSEEEQMGALGALLGRDPALSFLDDPWRDESPVPFVSEEHGERVEFNNVTTYTESAKSMHKHAREIAPMSAKDAKEASAQWPTRQDWTKKPKATPQAAKKDLAGATPERQARAKARKLKSEQSPGLARSLTRDPDPLHNLPQKTAKKVKEQAAEKAHVRDNVLQQRAAQESSATRRHGLSWAQMQLASSLGTGASAPKASTRPAPQDKAPSHENDTESELH